MTLDEQAIALAAARARTGMTQTYTARMVGATQQAYSEWEAGHHRPGRRYWAGIADVLGVDLDGPA
jgi:DNA-binding XRE family transcriptional regulator